MDQAKDEYDSRCREAARQGKPKPAPSAMTYFSKAHKLRAATVIPNILTFASQHGLKLTDDESRDDTKAKRREYRELEGKESNWVKYPEDSIYYTHLEYLSKVAPKLLALEGLIQSLGQDIYGRPEKLVIFTSSPVISFITCLVCFLPFSRPCLSILISFKWLRSKYPPQQTSRCSFPSIFALFEPNNTAKRVLFVPTVALFFTSLGRERPELLLPSTPKLGGYMI